jgi:hypothetical protein
VLLEVFCCNDSAFCGRRKMQRLKTGLASILIQETFRMNLWQVCGQSTGEIRAPGTTESDKEQFATRVTKKTAAIGKAAG